MRYPLDENVDQYPGKIHFIPIVERYVDAAQITAGNLLEAIGVDQFNGEGGAGEPGMRSSGATAPSPKSYSVPLTTYGQNASGPVTLYLPQAIVVADQVNYERINLGIIGASALTALQSGKSVTEAISGALAEAGRSASDFLTNRTGLGTQLAGLAAVRLAETVGNDTFRGVSRRTTECFRWLYLPE